HRLPPPSLPYTPLFRSDYLVVRLDPEPRVFSLYCTAKLNADQVQRFPSLSPLVTNPGAPAADKAVLDLYPRHAAQVARSLPLRLDRKSTRLNSSHEWIS